MQIEITIKVEIPDDMELVTNSQEGVEADWKCYGEKGGEFYPVLDLGGCGIPFPRMQSRDTTYIKPKKLTGQALIDSLKVNTRFKHKWSGDLHYTVETRKFVKGEDGKICPLNLFGTLTADDITILKEDKRCFKQKK